MFSLSITITVIYYNLTNKVFHTTKTFLNKAILPSNIESLNYSKSYSKTFTSSVNVDKFDKDSELIMNLFSLNKELNLLEDSKSLSLIGRDNLFSLKNLSFSKKILNVEDSFDSKLNFKSNTIKRESDFFLSAPQVSLYNTLSYIDINSKDLGVLTGDQNLHTIITNISNNSNISKQLRWSLKNSLVSENLAISNNNYLSSKRLLDSSLSDPNLAETNLTASNLFSDNNLNASVGNFFITNRENFLNINNFEESLEFLQKKYLFSINQRNIIISKSLLTQDSGNSVSQNLKNAQISYNYMNDLNNLNALSNNYFNIRTIATIDNVLKGDSSFIN
jgi:hypothetical protein